MRNATLLRHGMVARVLHGIDALVVIVLLLTGLALGGALPDGAAAWLGGHVGVDAVHRVLGVAFAAALLLLLIILPRRVVRLWRDVARCRRGDGHWPLRFARFYVLRGIGAAPFHDGRFDPAQRLVFMGILLGIAIASLSGVYLYVWTPSFPFGQATLGYAIRVHIVSAWLLIVCVCVHIVAGSGVLWTHRGLVGAMFGDGHVGRARARDLWPGWTERVVRHEATPPREADDA